MYSEHKITNKGCTNKAHPLFHINNNYANVLYFPYLDQEAQ